MKLIENLGYIENKPFKRKRKYGIYECSFCGNHKKADFFDVKYGKIKSCGCLRTNLYKIEPKNGFILIKDLGIVKKERRAIFKCPKCDNIFEIRPLRICSGEQIGCKKCNISSTKHGMCNTRLYRTYRGMIERCRSIKRRDSKHYSLKGITVCKEWLQFEAFKDWALSNGYTDKLTIDRINSDGDYEPSNCRFVTYQVQAASKNMMKTNTTGYKGVTKKNNNKYNSRIMINGKRTTIGTFETALEASNAYDNYIIENNLIEYKTNKELRSERN